MEIIKVTDLNFSYDDQSTTLSDISFSVEKGSYTSIIGHNGSGKSTLAKLLIGLLSSKAGEIQISGRLLNEDTLYEIRSDIGVVFQNPDNQFIGSSVADDIAFGLENHQVASEDMQTIIETFAKKVNMLDYLDKEPTKLSGGQKQRVAIAGILAMDLNVIILDEATSMLDPQGKKEINDLVAELHKKNKLTIISITHDMEEVALSDSVIVLEAGKIKMQGSPLEVMEHADELIAMQLDVPFAYKVQRQLSEKGIVIEKSLELEGVVDALCQLNSKI